MFDQDMYKMGYDDYIRSGTDGRKCMLDTAYNHVGDSYWEGVKSAYFEVEGYIQ